MAPAMSTAQAASFLLLLGANEGSEQRSFWGGSTTVAGGGVKLPWKQKRVSKIEMGVSLEATGVAVMLDHLLSHPKIHPSHAEKS